MFMLQQELIFSKLLQKNLHNGKFTFMYILTFLYIIKFYQYIEELIIVTRTETYVVKN